MSVAELPFKTIEQAPIASGTRVLLRASLNVPLVEGAVTDIYRIKKVCETIAYLAQRGARTVILAHIGRDPKDTLAPVYEMMKELVPGISFFPSCVGEETKRAADMLPNGGVLLLENVRCDMREEENDDAFANELSQYGELFVNDAFADSHREHASIVGIPKHLPSYAGLQFVREYEMLSRALAPERPALFILGGAKFETKLPLVERFLAKYDRIFIGGALANDVLKGRGCEIGTSLISDINLTGSTLLHDERIVVPSDVVVEGPDGRMQKPATAVSKDEKILDAGEESLRALAPHIESAKFILWNGPLGNYEAGYGEATDELGRLIANSPGASIIGGGDTVAAIEKLGLYEKFDFVSTAGGAMLVFLEHGTLPGIDALKAFTA